jgi:hypothetical protein
MTQQKDGARPASSRPLRGDRAKDEVYRQMFLLEERRPGAEIGLALALLRAWLAAASNPATDDQQTWMLKVLPICVNMIEAALQGTGAVQPCAH